MYDTPNRLFYSPSIANQHVDGIPSVCPAHRDFLFGKTSSVACLFPPHFPPVLDALLFKAIAMGW